MADRDVEAAATTEGLPVAPSMAPEISRIRIPRERRVIDARTVWITAAATLIGVIAAFVARGLTALIGLITNVSFYGRFSVAFVSPAENELGLFVVVVPVAGAVLIGLMARYGSTAIRGHGIPEAMEQILFNKSRIPLRVTFLKPLSAAISIGTGGPFGAEGPIIATGGALGSFLGQLLEITADERKTLLAAGAAAGMTATFGSPIAAVLLAVELLLFEYRPRSLIPVAFASATATGIRVALVGTAPVFAMPDVVSGGELALIGYVIVGAVVGLASIGATRLVYRIEDAFDRLPIHWMWWPVLGALPVGLIGYLEPRTMGVGYDLIEQMVSGDLLGRAVIVLCLLKLASWSISLGSGTSGGTLAPLFIIGGGLGASLSAAIGPLFPEATLDPRVGALVGMAAMFAGASRAFLASVVFAFEATRQPATLLPLLGGCGASFLVSCLWMKDSIMTEKIARRGARVSSEYSFDLFNQVAVREAATCPAATLSAEESVAQARDRLAVAAVRHRCYPVVDEAGRAIGMLREKRLFDAQDADRSVSDLTEGPALVIAEGHSLREAIDMMAASGHGRLAVVSEGPAACVIGLLTRGDILVAYQRHLHHGTHKERTFAWFRRERLHR